MARTSRRRLVRFGIAIEPQLLAQLDHWAAKHQYTNRSEALRDLVRRELVADEWQAGSAETMATITLVYDHHTRLLPERLTEVQHHYLRHIVSTLHVHLDHRHCLEVIVVRGRPAVLQELAGRLLAARGGKHGRLIPATTASGLP